MNKIFRDISRIEFKLLSSLSPYLTQKPDSISPHLILGSHSGVVAKNGVKNSHQSIQQALKKGYSSLEVDISFSSDFKPYVFHGPEITLAGIKGRFSDYSSKEIEKLMLKNGEPIIALKELFRKYGKRYKRIYLDVKSDNSNYQIKAKMLRKAIDNIELGHLVLIGNPWKILKSVKNALPEVVVGFEQKGAIVNYLLGADMVSLYYKYEFSYAEYKLARMLGLDVLIWTINDLNLLKEISKTYRVAVLTDIKNPRELYNAGIIWH